MAEIKHVVVLMLENRSFDHMLGYLKASWPELEGLTGAEDNPVRPGDPASPRVPVADTAEHSGVLATDPGHDFADVVEQVCGAPGPTVCPEGANQNEGFVANYVRREGDGADIMRCFAPEKLPVLTALAEEFAVCDHWFSSLPGPTWPNRFFVHCASSGGHVDNALRLYRMRTIYDNLAEAGLPWKIYYHDVPQSLALARLLGPAFKGRFRKFGDHFPEDAAAGGLPAYSFIEPRYFNFLWKRANDQHPDHDVALGEDLIAQVYEAVRSSPNWEETLLVVTWDEHGGTYDHLAPFAAVPPGDAASANPTFDFSRYGPRVPAILVSPLIPRRTRVDAVLDHSSVPATVKQIFGLPDFLTARDAAANTFEGVASLASARTDTPETLARDVREDRLALTADNVRLALAAGEASQEPLNELQGSLLALADSLQPVPTAELRALRAAHVPATEHEAARYVRESVARFLLTP